MNARTRILGLGAAITTFLLAGAVTIELVGGGGAPGLDIIGVGVGISAGLLAGALVSVTATGLSKTALAALIAYATVGAVFVAIAGLRYLNAPYVDTVFTFPVQVGVSLLAAIVVALLTLQQRPRGETTTV